MRVVSRVIFYSFLLTQLPNIIASMSNDFRHSVVLSPFAIFPVVLNLVTKALLSSYHSSTVFESTQELFFVRFSFWWIGWPGLLLARTVDIVTYQCTQYGASITVLTTPNTCTPRIFKRSGNFRLTSFFLSPSLSLSLSLSIYIYIYIY